MENHKELIQHVKDFISNNRTEKALELLAKSQLSGLDKELIILNSRYSKVKEDQRLGVLDDDIAQRKINTINRDLLELSEKIGKKSISQSSFPSSFKSEKTINKWWVIAPVFLVTAVIIIYFVWPQKEVPVIENPPITMNTDSINAVENYSSRIKKGDAELRRKNYGKAKIEYDAAIAAANGFSIDLKDAKEGLQLCEEEMKKELAGTPTVSFTPPSNPDPLPTPTTVKIGDEHAGGIIFYLAKPNEDLNGDGIPDKGLVAAPTDQGTKTVITWSPTNVDIPNLENVENSLPLSAKVLESSVGKGANNTNTIVQYYTAAEGEKIAAKLCADLNFGGYSDWFLPSIGELNLMYNNIGKGAASPNTNRGGFSGLYWSSSEEI